MLKVDHYLENVVKIALEAGKIILTHYAAGPEVHEIKGDDSPLTKADLEADQYIGSALKKLTPDIPIISEETALIPYEQRKNWTRFWLVDPLDGTKEFLKRNGEFTVNIALVSDGAPILGVVYAPAKSLLYFAASGCGSWKQTGNEAPTRLFSTPPDKSKPLTVVESRSHGSGELAESLAPCVIGKVVQVGSSLKFCLVAEGAADVYPRLGPTMEWDVAAGDCIFRNSTSEGQRASPLEYNKPTLKNSAFTIGF